MSSRAISIAVFFAFCCLNCLGQQNTNNPSAAPAPKGTFASDSRESAPLGSIAHQQQAQKSASTPSKHRVITDEDMPSHPAPAAEVKKTTRSSQSKDPNPANSTDTAKPKEGG